MQFGNNLRLVVLFAAEDCHARVTSEVTDRERSSREGIQSLKSCQRTQLYLMGSPVKQNTSKTAEVKCFQKQMYIYIKHMKVRVQSFTRDTVN